MNDHFGEKIKELRKSRGLSQKELAKQLRLIFPESKVSQASISKLELQKYAPRGAVIERFEAFFGCAIPRTSIGDGNKRCPDCGHPLSAVTVINGYNFWVDSYQSNDGLLCASCMIVYSNNQETKS
ncbi:MAG: helix-turn-helix domain-containing protein [Gammaproteobacteria bacterium]|nr:helix-turn-helix domain-containing protein [Gammaproteobacteria bacterium]